MSSTLATGNIFHNGRQFYCNLCGAGKSCESTGMTAPSNVLCAPGYFCKLGAPTSTPYCTSPYCANMYGICPVGNYCPAGTIDPITCPDGSYNNHTGASVCMQCPAGYYCKASQSTVKYFNCPLGYYCPTGTGANLSPCPLGNY